MPAALLFLLVPAVAWLGYEAGQAKRRREGGEPIAPPVLDFGGTISGVYFGDSLLNSDWGSSGSRSYVILTHRPGLGYRWSPVFVSDPFRARTRVSDPRLQGDGWLFTYQSGEWIRVVGR